MTTLFYYLTVVAVLAVAIVLLLGVLGLAKGTSSNASQKLMRWRVALQFVAIVVIMAAVYFARR